MLTGGGCDLTWFLPSQSVTLYEQKTECANKIRIWLIMSYFSLVTSFSDTNIFLQGCFCSEILISCNQELTGRCTCSTPARQCSVSGTDAGLAERWAQCSLWDRVCDTHQKEEGTNRRGNWSGVHLPHRWCWVKLSRWLCIFGSIVRHCILKV